MTQRYSPEEISEILRSRAEKAAQNPDEGAERQLIAKVAVVGIGEQHFGIPMESLAEISRTPPVSHLPGMPPSIRGIAQIRGELIGVIDVARWFGIDSASSGLLAVVENPTGRLGLLVDSVVGFREVIAEDLVDSFCDDAKSTGHPITGTTKDLIAIVDLDQLFRCQEVCANFNTTPETRRGASPERSSSEQKENDQ